ncbi:MAG: hypothetical protein CMF69_01205 [Magnetovibrio sp.]|nr:hypothetical protein [Magnetovibrio sp.]
MAFILFDIFKKRQSRQLNRDLPIIIEQAEKMFADSRLSKIAGTVSAELHRAHKMFGTEPVNLRRAHYEYRKLHREARRNNNQAELTAMTLVIIHLRAEIVGGDALRARTGIEKFIERYKNDKR